MSLGSGLVSVRWASTGRNLCLMGLEEGGLEAMALAPLKCVFLYVRLRKPIVCSKGCMIQA